MSCDPNNPYNPLPFYDSITTFDQPCERVKLRLVYVLTQIKYLSVKREKCLSAV